MLQRFNLFKESTKVCVLFLFVVAITFLCFIPTLFNDLLMTWDDMIGIVNNVQIRQLSIETVRWAFSTSYFRDWLPLVWISFALDYALWGLNPVGFHLTNNVLHALNAGLFYLISLALLKRYVSRDGNSSTLSGNRVYYSSLLAALLFSLHPLRVESVAWAFERKDVLSLFFGLIALLAYIRYISSEEVAAPTNRFSFLGAPLYWLAILFYCLSLFSKAMLVSFPLVLLILDWFPLKRINRVTIGTVLLEKTLFILCAGINSIILMTVHTSTNMPYDTSNMLSRTLIAFKSIMVYLLNMVWPVNLSPFYLHPQNIQDIGFEYLFPIFFFIVITVCCVLSLRRWPVCMSVWLIYLVTLVPVLGFIQVNVTERADRYTYVPGLAVSLLIALGIVKIIARYSASDRVATAVTAAGTLLILSVYSYLTVRQISFWKNDVTLWSRAIDLQPHFSGRMYFERATAFEDRGEFDKALTDMNEAIAIAIRRGRPNMEELYFKRSRIYKQLGETERATADYNYGLSLVSGQK